MKKPHVNYHHNFLLHLHIILLAAGYQITSVSSWNKDQFPSCDETPFCKRARSLEPGSCNVIATDVSISDCDLTAKLVPKKPPENNEDQIKPLIFILSAYQDDILRVNINEDNNLDPPKKRLELPYVFLPELLDKKICLLGVSEEKIEGDLGTSSVVSFSNDYQAVLRHDPFAVFVREKGGKRVISLNSNGLFNFEQLRVKKEGEDWQQRFKSHTDTTPYGPQSITLDVSFYGAEFVYGIPEHATSLALKPTRGPGVDESEPYRLFNLDVFEYLHDSPFGIYGSIPVMLSHGRVRGTSGFFWANAAEIQVDVLGPGWNTSLPSDENGRIDTLWMSEAGIVDAFFFVGPTPKEVVQQYTTVTGTTAMPQLFATAYHQCRWNYRDEEDVKQVDSMFDEHDIPYDVMWLDIEHTDEKKYFTWDKNLFANPIEMQNNLTGKGRYLVTIVDPHMKRDESNRVHKEATEKGYYVKDANGKDFDGWCWPGSSSYPDMMNPEIRSWWADKFSYEFYVGSTPNLYIWNDMNEPSVFNGPELTMPRDALHIGGIEHREMHNAYGYYFHMGTFEGLQKRGDFKDRPFILSRAFFAGSQRYGAVWTGDNTASWEHLKVSVPMLLTLGLTGMTFSGADVGGFFGNPEPELLVRWYQLASYYPFFRAHAHHDTKRREPWLFGERNTELIREAIHLRYTLLPYFYTLFREANTTGVPVMRPLWMEFPSDESTFSEDEEFMVGSSILVKGIFTKKAKDVFVHLPKGQSWYLLSSGTAYNGGSSYNIEVMEECVPSFQRAGTIVPRKDRFRRSTTQMTNDPYTLVIALNGTQEAEGELYIDDGRSYEFLKGAYIHRRFVFSNEKLTSSKVVGSSPLTSGNQDQFSSDCTIERIIILGLSLGSTKTALIEPSSHKTDIVLAPLHFGLKSGPSVVTIRKPNVRIADDWTINIL